MLETANRAGAPLELDACAGELRFARGSRQARQLDPFVCALQSLRGGDSICGDAVVFDAEVAGLDLELAQYLRHAVARRRRVLDGMTERGGGVGDGKYFASRRFDIRLETFDAAVRRFVGRRFGGERLGGAVALLVRLDRRRAPRGERRLRRLAARVEAAELGFHRGRPRIKRSHLLAIERNLLLAPVDGQLARVRRLAPPRGA